MFWFKSDLNLQLNKQFFACHLNQLVYLCLDQLNSTKEKGTEVGASARSNLDIRFSLTEANFCALLIDWRMFGHTNSFHEIFVHLLREHSEEESSDISNVISMCIRTTMKGINGK